MKIAFFTETNFTGKIPRSYPNLRTDMAWLASLDADHWPISFDKYLGEYDLGIVIFPKQYTNLNELNTIFSISKFKSYCKKVLIMQEGPCNLWEDFSIDIQVLYFNALQDCDGILCHNDSNINYFSGLVDNKPVYVMQTLMLSEPLKNEIIQTSNRTGTIVGGNMTSWYGGWPSMMVALEINEPISIVSMGRKNPNEEKYFPDVRYIPYMDWSKWMAQLSKYKYAVHLMPTHAAGTFALNCAYLGIPCIGYTGLDTQEQCHGNLTVELFDIETAKKIAKKLATNERFYNDCSEDAKHSYNIVYSESLFREKMLYRFTEILNS